MNAMDAAKCFINLFKNEEEGVSNLKLQKLLYYVQGFSYQRYGRPFFDEEMEAWEYGPVVASVHREFRQYGREPIRNRYDVDLSKEEQELILDVAREFGQYTGSTLVRKTHAPGSPWALTYDEDDPHKIIEKELIKRHFTDKEPVLDRFDINKFLTGVVPEVSGNSPIPLKEWDYE